MQDILNLIIAKIFEKNVVKESKEKVRLKEVEKIHIYFHGNKKVLWKMESQVKKSSVEKKRFKVINAVENAEK